jgi:hypothetical protein
MAWAWAMLSASALMKTVRGSLQAWSAQQGLAALLGLCSGASAAKQAVAGCAAVVPRKLHCADAACLPAGSCSAPAGELVVEANTAEVRQATVSPKYGALALQAPPPGATAAVPLVAGASGRCIRSPHCTKAAGHPGFCSGPKAAAAAAAKQQQVSSRTAACQPGLSEASARGVAAHSTSSGEEAATRLGTPRSRTAAASTGEFSAGARLPQGLHQVASVPTGLRLVKVLTAYDLTSQRVVMPVPDTEAGIPNAPTTDQLTLAAVDESQRWHFPTLHAWTNVAGRRGYLLDGLAGMLANRGAQEGDSLVVYRDTHLQPPVSHVCAGCRHSTALGVGCGCRSGPASVSQTCSCVLLLCSSSVWSCAASAAC